MIRQVKKKLKELNYKQALELPEFQKLYGLKDESIKLAQQLCAAITAAENRSDETKDFTYGEEVGRLFTKFLFIQSDLEVEMAKIGELFILPEQCQVELADVSTLWLNLRN
jgi:hypothetical protein